MARFKDLMELKNDTARGNAIRERVAKFLYEVIKNLVKNLHVIFLKI